MKIKDQNQIIQVQHELHLFLVKNKTNFTKICKKNKTYITKDGKEKKLLFNTVYKWFHCKKLNTNEYYPIHVENINTVIKLVDENASFNQKKLTIK